MTLFYSVYHSLAYNAVVVSLRSCPASRGIEAHAWSSLAMERIYINQLLRPAVPPPEGTDTDDTRRRPSLVSARGSRSSYVHWVAAVCPGCSLPDLSFSSEWLRYVHMIDEAHQGTVYDRCVRILQVATVFGEICFDPIAATFALYVCCFSPFPKRAELMLPTDL